MAGLLDGKVAVITGAASGMGRAMALAFTEEGAKAVVVADLQEQPREGGESTVDLVRAAGGQSVFVRTDVTSPEELTAAVAAATEFGGLDVFVNNAGIFRNKPITETTEADFDLLMGINLKGTYFGAQAAARALIAQGRGGVILNLSSVAGIQGSRGFSAYNASKGGVRLLTYSLADELGEHGIRVNAIHPGIVETVMTTQDVPVADKAVTPLGRNGRPEDVAKAAVYLASDAASYVSGTSLVVDGAMSRVM
ncbi:SDR family NAD(P)-dependent oxidoreductase [Streptomyces sp. NPDC001255]|uniref:SDR family NAD(P)-dependent oxidoreductase n=1 Tax=Streptomyces sp. NPDC001255 TaxID=3364550 RepID=UPI00367512A9